MSEPPLGAQSPGTPPTAQNYYNNRVRTPSGYSKHVSSQPSTPVIQEGFYFPGPETSMYSTVQQGAVLYGTLPKVMSPTHPSHGVTPAATILETSHPNLLANQQSDVHLTMQQSEGHYAPEMIMTSQATPGCDTRTHYLSLSRPGKVSSTERPPS